jgi:signal transduction histidine kinase
MAKIKILTLLFLLFFTFTESNSQENTIFYKIVSEKSKNLTDNESFNKSSYFFFNKKWDSTLVSSSKFLKSKNENDTLKDYSHFFRGYSFHQKGISNQAILELKKISKNFVFYQNTKIIIGEILIEQTNFSDAIPYFLNAINFGESNQFVNKNSVIHNLGLCYLHLKKFNKAENFLVKSSKFLEQNKDTLELIGAYGDIATLYYEQYKDNLAIPYFHKAYNLAKKTTDLDLKRLTAKNMAVVEENRKNFQKSLAYRKEMEKWKDSLNDQNRIYEVAQKEKEFAVKQKQNEVDILQVQNELQETQRTIFLYSAIGLLILLGIGYYFYREKVKSNQIIASQKETLDELNTTKDKLFSIVSHDLRSSVNALKSSNKVLVDNLESKNLSALENLLQKNSSIVNGAYGLLDNLLNWALIQTEQQYFHIDKHRLFIITEHVAYNYKPLLLEKELIFENTVLKKDVIYADQESLKIVLRNLLDNAIKFSTQNGSIKVYSRNISDDYCDLIVEDTGLGMSEETRLKLLEDSVLLNKKEHEDVIGTGLGLQLCKSMIKKNNGKFTIESELGKGTKMIVSLPKISLNEQH